MLVLEVLQTCPTQWKSLLYTLGVVDPADTRLITFYLDSGEPHLPALITFQILVKIWNITVHRCIIDEGASTCIMSKTIWQKLGSLELIPSAITLRAYDGRPSSSEGLFQNVPVELGGKTILIDIEVIDAPLDYNILFGRSYMYAMKAVASSVFQTMMFPHNGKIMTIDQVSHYEPNPSANLDNILPLIHTNQDAYPLIQMGPGIFKDPSLLGMYHGAPPLFILLIKYVSSHLMELTQKMLVLLRRLRSFLTSQQLQNHSCRNLLHTRRPQQSTNPHPLRGIVPFGRVPQPLTQIPFFYPPPGIEAIQVAAMLALPNMMLAIPVWYLHPPEMVP
jgi:hypothetical protein